MTHILLPTDYSKNSLNGMAYAMGLLEHWDCTFFILNVQKGLEYVSTDLESGSNTASVYSNIATDNTKTIHQLVKKMRKQFTSKSHTFHGLFDNDNFTFAVSHAVKANAIDLIIMGSNGATGAKEVVFGSHTIQLIRAIECPILTVPEQYAYTGITKALFTTQRSEDLSFKGITIFKDLLISHQCELVVLELDDDAIVMSKKEDNEALKALFSEQPYTYLCLNKLTDLNAINAVTQVLKIDIHAAFIKKESVLERLLFGSETTQMAYGTLIPLLFLPS